MAQVLFGNATTATLAIHNLDPEMIRRRVRELRNAAPRPKDLPVELGKRLTEIGITKAQVDEFVLWSLAALTIEMGREPFAG